MRERLISVVFLSVGVGTLGLGALMGAGALRMRADGVVAPGTVVALEREENRRTEKGGRTITSVSFHPVVEYTGEDGQVLRFRSGVGQTESSWQVGATVPVLHLPNEPESAVINDFSSLWLGPLISGGLGLLAVLAGVALWPRRRKERA